MLPSKHLSFDLPFLSVCWYEFPGQMVGKRFPTLLRKTSEKIETELVPVILLALQVYNLDEVKIQKVPTRDAGLCRC